MPQTFGPTGGNDSFDEFLARLLAASQNPGQSQRSVPFGRPVDITRLLSRRTHELLQQTAAYAVEQGQHEIDALHVLHVLVGTEPFAAVLRSAGADPERFAAEVEQRLPMPSGDRVEGRPALTPSAQRILLEATQAARGFGSTYTDPEHVFFALVTDQDTVAGQLLASAGVTPQVMQSYAHDAAEAAREGRPMPGTTTADQDQQSETPTLDQYGTDLTARARDGRIDPVIGRADEIEQAVEILLRRTKNNPVLIGEPGVGKTAIVEGLAQRIVDGDVPALLQGKRVVALDLPGMLAGTRYRGDFEERLTKAMDEIAAHADELIVFVDELHTVVGAGGGGEGGSMDAGNILKPRLARGDLHLVGATTLKEYRRIEKDAALERRFQPVTVGEPSLEDAVAILTGLSPRYAEHHGVTYSDEALRAAVELSHRYVTDRHLPDKAIDLIDQAGARRRLARSGDVDVDALRAEVADLTARKDRAVAEEQYEEASDLRDEIAGLEARITAADTGEVARSSRPHAADDVITEADIAAVVSRATGIPVTRLGSADKTRLAGLESELHDRVVGQDDAVRAIAKAVRRSRTGMGDPRRPVGSFLFLGPTGVGKTELAKALASSLFGDESAMLRFDMSEFGERHTVSRLVGAPPGYVGYDEAGQLTERVRRNPYSVILLDEVEKAHPDVFNLLLQVLDDGRLTDGQGRTVDFRNTVVIMTSNIGSEFLASRSGALGFSVAADGGYAEDDLRNRVMGRLRESMRPEFINRIDEIVLFRKLERGQLRSIVSLLLQDTALRLAAQGMVLSVSESATDWLAEHGYEPEYGARPLRRLIQREVDDRIAELVVEGATDDGVTVRIDVVDDEVVALVDASVAV
ncbi:ATP-dependent Clp protease ATP-binding subunit [Curtobacterium sp. MCJR17_055]|uniref:ATP-dependent Clp protease ATP-binding subunit n=1 Tax=unclassified Curtobacterium TaxID=257496 RepID=UPI000D8E1C8E|nr:MULTISPECIES: ATP-dependent Clp protease ATP-binding subunit [unclassified Curtobacterium]PYY35028.1 ATP-dependent Clp protease ATP-binding subunit [Curtobacterium sp. MCBD17_029]PYY55692.1 ATP-dependent Clp protease ATP-binding subunit [Curtobacterium sp. MCJR17_055]PYY60437.1 ATP-dependent Clp protease ATP-binding subunit [Curtobacterium sp. MCPF17_015]